jgi:hypothetical protein
MTETVKLKPEEERLRELLRRADALNFAHAAVLHEEWGHPETKAQMLEALEEVRVEDHERFKNYRQEVGLLGPSA